MDLYDIYADQPLAGTTFSTTTAAADFDQCYLCYPLSYVSKTHHEAGNKIIMPVSALNQLASIIIVYPMLFRIENTTTGHHSHCGVLDFTADEGFVFLPTWMMNNLQLHEGQLVNIKNTSLPKGNCIKLQPHATTFTTLSDHKSLLEKAFRDFICLTTGDTIVVNHGDEKYVIDVVDTKPSPAILLFETDCEVDLLPPLDYKQPEKKTTVVVDGKPEKKHEMEFKPFAGVGRRVDGQPLSEQTDQSKTQVDVKNNDERFKAFAGKSYRLL